MKERDLESPGARTLRWQRWLPWAVMVFAAALRLVGVGEWSLWEDEETSIYFSQHPERRFPRAFPIFFLLLGGLYDVTGVSVLAGRLLAVGIGLLTLWLAWRLARRFATPSIAMVALVVLALSPAHLFWSQSIRYYGLVLLFQLASVYSFLAGMSTGRLWLLIVANVALVAAIKTHPSAGLLAPVFVVWFLWLAWREGPSRDLLRKAVVFFGPPAIVLATFWQRAVRMLGGSGASGIDGDPVHVLATAVIYFGPPAWLLATIGVLKIRRASKYLVLFLLLAMIPMVELLVIVSRDQMHVTYYYGLIALVGIAVLAGHGWEALVTSRSATVVFLALAAAFHLTVFIQYYGVGFGDRPRWKDAAAYVSQDARGRSIEPTVFATVPGAVAFHLGIDPAATMGHPRVRGMHQATFAPPRDAAYYVVEQRTLSPARLRWLGDHCEFLTMFESHFLTRDRTVAVFHCSPAP